MIKVLISDIGGVLLTNGWDHTCRNKAVEKFRLDPEITESRHDETFGTYELGKITLDEYLERVIFYKEQKFSKNEFKEFVFSCSQPLPGMLPFLKQLKKKYQPPVATISNEGKELVIYRNQTFKLDELFDVSFYSCYTHLRKPDYDFFQLAIDSLQISPEQALYIDDRQMFAEVAAKMGMNSIHHIDFPSTRQKLEKWGFNLPDFIHH